MAEEALYPYEENDLHEFDPTAWRRLHHGGHRKSDPQIDGLMASLSAGFLDRRIESRGDFRPSVVYNDTKSGLTVLAKLLEEFSSLQAGDEFRMAVAFITLEAVDQLLLIFDELRRRGVRGKILTGTYLYFNDPKAFRALLRYPDLLEVRILDRAEHEGLHAKGYYFRRGEIVDLLVGSSNLTMSALKGNLEWNLSVSSTRDGSVVQSFTDAFDLAWNHPQSTPLTQDFLDRYVELQGRARARRVVDVRQEPSGPIEPNAMQREALAGLAAAHADNEPRALVISATGSGKTYLAAFEVREQRPKRVLFVVHRERIARDALKSFRRVLGDAYTYGIFAGGERDTEATCIFSTIQTLVRPDNLRLFAPDEFDYVIIDEVHRAGAKSYQALLEYLHPSFLLGMSATPERTDDFDVYALFNHVVPFEIRLQGALENHLVTPFHYFGVSGLDKLDMQGRTQEDFAREARMMAEQSEKFQYSGPRLKGLIFCSRLEECEGVSEELNRLGYRSVSLSGSTSDAAREDAIRRLEANAGDDLLDFLVSVDVFNEGIDIPTVNQVILARPTTSPIVFVQQLGRGLRIDTEKQFVVVIDFVGNYENNYNIPIALTGDRTHHKEHLRHGLASGGSFIPGTSTVQFDEIAGKRVLRSINNADFSKLATLKTSFKNLSNRLGRRPDLEDFREWGETSPYLMFENKSLGSYHEFLLKCDKTYVTHFSENQRKILRLVSTELSYGKRPTDLVATRLLMEGDTNIDAIVQETHDVDLLFGAKDSLLSLEDEARSSVRGLNLDFYVSSARKKWVPLCGEVDDEGRVRRSPEFAEALQDAEFRRQLNEVIDYGLRTFSLDYTETQPGIRLCINQRYSRKDACRLLNWRQNEEGTVNGYSFKGNEWLVFVTYRKSSGIAKSQRYEDEFLSPQTLVWYSQSNRRFGSKDHAKLMGFDPARNRIHLFVKLDDTEATDHYYLGTMRPVKDQITEEKIVSEKGKELPILRVPMLLDHEVGRETYRYLTK